MTIANEIIRGAIEQVEYLLDHGEDINDLDEYGFTPLIETAIIGHNDIAKMLLERGAEIDKPDASGRTALHWAVDNANYHLCRLLLEKGANPNTYTRGAQPVLAHPLLRDQRQIKQLLYDNNADLNFAKDFINTKLLGHRFELESDVDILNADGEFIEIDYEGFILEFTLNIIKDSLSRFKRNYAARRLRGYFNRLNDIIQAISVASNLIKYQHNVLEIAKYDRQIDRLLENELLILPIAYKGHAITFVKCGRLLAKCDRGEFSLEHGSVNIYYIQNEAALNKEFLKNLLYKKQSKRYVEQHLYNLLGLQAIAQLPLSSQVTGNCSWANVEAAVPTAYLLLLLNENLDIDMDALAVYKNTALNFYEHWLDWDKDRALHDCIQSFNEADSPARKASKASSLAAILFQSCDYANPKDMERAEKILAILTDKKYEYILQSYINIYAEKKLTKKGNNLLHILDDLGINPQIRVHPLPVPMDEADKKD